ncbi:MAG: hypothetical protein IT373_30165 [Polyangiaceae bacterium]|nr:hypothetical protein [Polyangiaceae bacterium]
MTREQAHSAFTTILEALVEACPDSVGAVLVDNEGEAVDYAGELAAFDLKLTGAHWQIVMRHLAENGVMPATKFVVRGDRLGYVVIHLCDGYVLVLACRPDAAFSISQRALRQCELELAAEAGWPMPAPKAMRWTRVNVRLDAVGRPVELSLRGRSRPLKGLRPALSVVSPERGYALKTARGVELTLICEPSGLWYLGGRVGG